MPLFAVLNVNHEAREVHEEKQKQMGNDKTFVLFVNFVVIKQPWCS